VQFKPDIVAIARSVLTDDMLFDCLVSLLDVATLVFEKLLVPVDGIHIPPQLVRLICMMLCWCLSVIIPFIVCLATVSFLIFAMDVHTLLLFVATAFCVQLFLTVPTMRILLLCSM